MPTANPTMSGQTEPDRTHQGEGVLSIELFFDLVFVFTVTQLTTYVVRHPTWRGVAEAGLLFGNLWWMFGGYAWLTNIVPPKRPSQQLLILLGMGGFLVIALAIPGAYGASGIAFGVGYFVVSLVHMGLFMESTDQSVVRAIRRLGPVNLATASLVLAGGFCQGTARWILWGVAFVAHWLTPYFSSPSPIGLRPGHFVERHSLIVLIALGESIIAAGIGLRTPALTASVLVTALLGLAIAATLWLLYSNQGQQTAERALASAGTERRAWLALYGFGYIFLLIIPGIVLFAAGVRLGVRYFDRPGSLAVVWLLAGGAALYCVGLAALRHVLHTPGSSSDLSVASLVLITPVLGRFICIGAQLGAVVVILWTAVIVNRNREPRSGTEPPDLDNGGWQG